VLTEWGAPGAFTRRYPLCPDDVPGAHGDCDSGDEKGTMS